MKVRPGVAVPDEALAVRDPGGLGVAGRGGPARVGHRHDQVRVGRVLHRQLDAHPAAGLVERPALEVRVRAGEVDELEDAERRCRLREADRAGLLAGLEDHDLARLDLADVLGADDVEAGRLRRQDPGVAGLVRGLRVAPQAARRVDRRGDVRDPPDARGAGSRAGRGRR